CQLFKVRPQHSGFLRECAALLLDFLKELVDLILKFWIQGVLGSGRDWRAKLREENQPIERQPPALHRKSPEKGMVENNLTFDICCPRCRFGRKASLFLERQR